MNTILEAVKAGAAPDPKTFNPEAYEIGLGFSPGIIAGVGAKTADLVELARMHQLMDADVAGNAAQRYREHGWYEGADLKPRFEIPDTNATIKRAPEAPGHKIAVRGVIDHPELFEAYPQLEDLAVSGHIDPNNAGGAVAYPNMTVPAGRGDIHLEAKNENQFKSLLLHELQHHVQGIEDFAAGGNPNYAAKEFPIQYQQAYADRMNKAYAHTDSAPGSWGEVNTQSADPAQLALQAKHDVYSRLAGEVEARNVQRRSTTPPQILKKIGPFQTQDTPDEMQLILSALGGT